MLKVENLCFQREGRDYITVKNLSFKAGIYVLWGSSGSGKTTFLKLLSGRLKAQGNLFFAESVCDLTCENSCDFWKMRQCGFHHQVPLLMDECTVEENLFLPFVLTKRQFPDSSRIEEIFDLMEINGLLCKFADAISTGEAQRVSLARILLYDPPLVFLDEPLVFVQKRLEKKILEGLFAWILKNKKICLIATHVPSWKDFSEVNSVLEFEDGLRFYDAQQENNPATL